MSLSRAIMKTPIWIWIDPSRHCNLACKLCYTLPHHKIEFMSLPTFKSAISKLFSSDLVKPMKLSLNWTGEPLLNKQFSEMMGYAASIANAQGVIPQVHTNGTAITKEYASRLTSISSPYQIYFSFDGLTAKQHDENRGAGSFSKSAMGFKNLLEARGGRKYPEVFIYSIKMSEHTLIDPLMKELIERADGQVSVDPVSPISGGGAKKSPNLSTDNWAFEPLGFVPDGPCFWAGNALCISPKGKVEACVLSKSRLGILGDIQMHSIDYILKQAKIFRSRIEQVGRKNIDHCRNCKKIEGRPFELF